MYKQYFYTKTRTVPVLILLPRLLRASPSCFSGYHVIYSGNPLESPKCDRSGSEKVAVQTSFIYLFNN